MSDVDECPICYSELESSTTLTAACGHSCCTVCLLNWIQSNFSKASADFYTFRCPYCNVPTSVTSIRNSEDEELFGPSVTSPWGQVYVQGSTRGLASYHFIEAGGSYISYENAHPSWICDDGSKPPLKKLFTDLEWDQSSRRLKACISWKDQPKLMDGVTYWTYDFVFSEDFLEVQSGICIMTDDDHSIVKTYRYGNKRQRTEFQPDFQPDFSPPELFYVLDGLKEKFISIKKMLFEKYFDGVCFECSNPSATLLNLPSCRHKICKTCLSVETKRASFEKRCKVCNLRYFATLVQIDDRQPLTIDSPMGYTFVQDGGVGVASYHFSEDQCYISYRNAPPGWRLDDASRPPETKPFSNWSYDKESRRFTGSIIWDVPFNCDVKWAYSFTFSQDFRHIQAGSVENFESIDEHAQPVGSTPFTNDSSDSSGLCYVLSECDFV